MSSSQEVCCCASAFVLGHEAADLRAIGEATLMAGDLISPYLCTAAC